jgi:hypothetical protein
MHEYIEPTFTHLGSLQELTLGTGASGTDGGNNMMMPG